MRLGPAVQPLGELCEDVPSTRAPGLCRGRACHPLTCVGGRLGKGTLGQGAGNY